MSITKEQQQALDDALVLRKQRLQIGSYNYILSTTFKPKEPIFQVALDVLSLTPFYPAFLITASVPAIYMHEFWTSASYHKHSIRFKFIPQHEVVQKYGAILPDNLTTQAMKESEAYKTYYAFATGKSIPKPKYVRRTTKEKTVLAPKASSDKRIKAAAKVTKSRKKKQPAQGLETLSEIAMSEAEHMKIALKRSKTQQHSSHASGSGADKGTCVKPGVPDVPTYGSDDEQISWKSSKEDDDDEVAQTDSDNDGDDFVHPKFSTHNEEDKEEDSFHPRVQTPSHVESADDEESDEEIQGANVKGDKHDEEETNEDVKANKLYKDVNINLEGRDIEMTNAQQINVEPT
ncbi:hypothetical protein Tco_1020811 [Tanacetum coccineum]